MVEHASALLYAALLVVLLVTPGCGREGELEDDDDASDDDDSGAVSDDDDATEDPCASPGPPYTVTLAGGTDQTLVFDTFECTDYNGDNWNLSYTNSDQWLMRLVVGPLVSDEAITHSIDITLIDQAQQESIYGGRTADGHVASATAIAYDGSPPCGEWTTEPLADRSAGGGPAVTLSVQPIPFRCD